MMTPDGPDPPESLRDAIREFESRRRDGETVDLPAFLARYPTIAPELSAHIQSLRNPSLLLPLTDGKSGSNSGSVAGSMADQGGGRSLPAPSIDSGHSTLLRGAEGSAASEATVLFAGTSSTADRGGTDASPGSDGPAGESGPRFQIQKELGRGAMGIVYLAFDTQLHRPVALKCPMLADDADPSARQRFLREARSAATLRHPNICPVFDAGVFDGRNFIAMAYIEGRPLGDFIIPGSLPSVRNALLVVRKIAMAVQEAHDKGIVHRDLKPSNILIDRKNEPIVMDFGLARLAHHGVDGDSEPTTGHPAGTQSDTEKAEKAPNDWQTREGMLVGTPRYMSPEQAAGKSDIGPASDIFSLGIILYELLTGRPPFLGRNLGELLARIASEAPIPLSQLRPEVSVAIENLCLRMLAKKPGERPASMRAVQEEIQSLVRSVSDSGTPLANRETASLPPGAEATDAGTGVVKNREARPTPPRSVDASPPRRGPGKLTWWVSGLFAAALLAAIVSFGSRRDGILHVILNVPEANLQAIDSTGARTVLSLRGERDVQLRLPAGKYTVVIEKEGFRSDRRDVVVPSGETTDLQVELTAVASRAPGSDSNQSVRATATANPLSERSFDSLTSSTAPIRTPENGDRELVEWFLSKNAQAEYQLVGESGPTTLLRVKAGDKIARAPIRLTRLIWDQKGTLPSWGPADFERMRNGVEVTRLELRNQVVPSVKWIAELPRLNTLVLEDCTTTDDAVIELGNLSRLRQLFFRCRSVTPKGLRFVSRLTGVEVLWFNAMRVTDEGLEHLPDLKSIRDLMLWASDISDDGLRSLAGLTAIEVLNLGANRKIHGSGFPHLAGLMQLRELQLTETSIDGEGLDRLPSLPGLRTLILVRTAVEETDVARLSRFPALERLELDHTAIRSVPTAVFNANPNLKVITLGGLPLGGQDLTGLTEVKGLHRLGVRETGLSPAEIGRLIEALPGCRVEPDPTLITGDDASLLPAPYLQEVIGRFTPQMEDLESPPLILRKEPVMSWCNSGDIGRVAVWTRRGRPTVVGGAGAMRDPTGSSRIYCEFSNLAAAPLEPMQLPRRTVPWTAPALPEHERPIEGSAEPADSSSGRQEQMLALAQEFDGSTWEQSESASSLLKVHPVPLLRYEAPDEGVLDGGLFALANSEADPQAVLLIECRKVQGANKPMWTYTAARYSPLNVRVRHRERVVATFPFTATSPYIFHPYETVPTSQLQSVASPPPRHSDRSGV